MVNEVHHFEGLPLNLIHYLRLALVFVIQLVLQALGLCLIWLIATHAKLSVWKFLLLLDELYYLGSLMCDWQSRKELLDLSLVDHMALN